MIRGSARGRERPLPPRFLLWSFVRLAEGDPGPFLGLFGVPQSLASYPILRKVGDHAILEAMARSLFSTGSAYEPIIGCSRAVRSGDLLWITATAPLGPDGKTTAAPDAYGQAKRCLEIIAGVIAEAGFALEDVVKTRVYFKAHGDWEEIARAHGETVTVGSLPAPLGAPWLDESLPIQRGGARMRDESMSSGRVLCASMRFE
jgi:enamine deaminase RidA (YjgF/YER057c/UK114 family)